MATKGKNTKAGKTAKKSSTKPAKKTAPKQKTKSLVIPTIFTIFTVGFLLTLGFWQLDRLEQKEALITKLEEAKEAKPARRLPKNLQEAEYKRYILSGRFDFSKEIHMGGRYYNGKVGYHILNPFRMTDGRTILVNRGWIPADKKDPKTRPETIKRITYRQVYGMAKSMNKRGWFTPKNSPESNIWFWYDEAGFEKQLKIKNLQPVVVQVIAKSEAQQKRLPIAGDSEIKLRNDHLNYAITWFLLAIGACVVFYFFVQSHKAKPKKKRK